MDKLGYYLILASGIVGILSVLLSWLWHRLDLQLPDPNERQEPWSPMQWALYQNRARQMRIIQSVGVLAMYLSLAGAVIGFLLVGLHGVQSR